MMDEGWEGLDGVFMELNFFLEGGFGADELEQALAAAVGEVPEAEAFGSEAAGDVGAGDGGELGEGGETPKVEELEEVGSGLEGGKGELAEQVALGGGVARQQKDGGGEVGGEGGEVGVFGEADVADELVGAEEVMHLPSEVLPGGGVGEVAEIEQDQAGLGGLVVWGEGFCAGEQGGLQGVLGGFIAVEEVELWAPGEGLGNGGAGVDAELLSGVADEDEAGVWLVGGGEGIKQGDGLLRWQVEGLQREMREMPGGVHGWGQAAMGWCVGWAGQRWAVQGTMGAGVKRATAVPLRSASRRRRCQVLFGRRARSSVGWRRRSMRTMGRLPSRRRRSAALRACWRVWQRSQSNWDRSAGGVEAGSKESLLSIRAQEELGFDWMS